MNASTSHGNTEPLQTMPTLRATAHPSPHANGSSQHLPTGPAHLDADELEDEFAYGLQRHAQPLRYHLDRGDDAAPASALGITFTLNGQRRRISLWNPLQGRTRRRIPSGGGVGARRRASKRAFLKRVGMDLVYIMWPATVLWLGLKWWLS